MYCTLMFQNKQIIKKKSSLVPSNHAVVIAFEETITSTAWKPKDAGCHRLVSRQVQSNAGLSSCISNYVDLVMGQLISEISFRKH